MFFKYFKMKKELANNKKELSEIKYRLKLIDRMIDSALVYSDDQTKCKMYLKQLSNGVKEFIQEYQETES